MKNNTALYSDLILREITLLAKALIFLFFSGFSLSASSQDLLKLKSGTELKVTVIEEGSGIVKYREFDDPSGPVYSISRDKVESIKYKKGSKPAREVNVNEQEEGIAAAGQSSVIEGQTGELTYKNRNIYLDGVKQGPREVKTLMEDIPGALDAFNKGRKLLSASTSCAFGVIITSIVTSSMANRMEDQTDAQKVRYTGLAIDAGFIITAIVLGSKGKSNLRKSITLYNSASGKPVTYNLNLGIQENGIGFGLKF